MELNIKLTEQEAQVVLKGLGKLLLEESIEVALKVKSQCEEQIEASKNLN